MLYDLRSVFEAEYQRIPTLGSDSRYFIVKGIHVAQNFLRHGNEGIFRDLFGRTVSFAQGVEGGADPHGSSFGDLSAVMLSTSCAQHHPGEWIGLWADPRMGVLVCPALYLLLNCVKLLQGDDFFVAIHDVVLWQLTVILPCAFGDMVFPVCLLEK